MTDVFQRATTRHMPFPGSSRGSVAVLAAFWSAGSQAVGKRLPRPGKWILAL